MQNQIDTNRVELSGRIAGDPTMRLIPPGCTFYIVFELVSRGEWPDHTGCAVLLEYRHHCFAQGTQAEAITWARNGDAVQLVGALDLVLDDYEPTQMMGPVYKPAVRVHQMKLIEEGEAK